MKIPKELFSKIQGKINPEGQFPLSNWRQWKGEKITYSDMAEQML